MPHGGEEGSVESVAYLAGTITASPPLLDAHRLAVCGIFLNGGSNPPRSGGESPANRLGRRHIGVSRSPSYRRARLYLGQMAVAQLGVIGVPHGRHDRESGADEGAGHLGNQLFPGVSR